jgi:hypothetical protein
MINKTDIWALDKKLNKILSRQAEILQKLNKVLDDKKAKEMWKAFDSIEMN